MQISAEDREELVAINATIANLQQSTRRTLPMFTVGVVVAIATGVWAIYFVFGMWSHLQETKAQLAQTRAALVQGQLAITRARTVLQNSPTTASSSNAAHIGIALNDLTASQGKLTTAARSLASVSSTLPADEAAAPPAPVPDVFKKPNGEFVNKGDLWIELPAYSNGKNFTFTELTNDGTYLYLVDRSRTKPGTTDNSMLVRLPLKGGTAQWSYQNPIVWNNFTIVQPVAE